MHLKIQALNIADVLLITPPRFGDERGFFAETYAHVQTGRCRHRALPFVQDNQSFSAAAGTLRGLHCQVAPQYSGQAGARAAGCHLGCCRRRASRLGQASASSPPPTCRPTISPSLWVPPGFLHGFVTLVPDTEVFLQSHRPVRPRRRARRAMGRSHAGAALAVTAGRPGAVRQGSRPARLGPGRALVRGMSSILVTGGTGQLATALGRAAPDRVTGRGPPGARFRPAGRRSTRCSPVHAAGRAGERRRLGPPSMPPKPRLRLPAAPMKTGPRRLAALCRAPRHAG